MTSTDDELAEGQLMDFGSLRIAYDDQVLLPRPWTEMQSQWAAELAPQVPPGKILELCAGAGQIGLLAASLTGRSLVAVDADATACRFAERNARKAGLDAHVEIRNVPLDRSCAPGERFPVIIADPPWVRAAETDRFPQDPLTAIDGGPDGLDVARSCLRVIDAHLAPDGIALLQLGDVDQVDTLRSEAPTDLQLTEVRAEGDRGVVVLVRRSDSSG